MSARDVIAIAAGGTGGHFFPAEALATELRARGHEVVLLTDSRGRTSEAFDQRFVLTGGGIAGVGPRRAAMAMAGMAIGTFQARRILRRLRPSAVVGFGGYPAVPPVLAARTLRPRPRVVLHEQNAVLGRANSFLSSRADGLALSHQPTARVPAGVVTISTGNPVRAAVHARPYAGGDVLVLGGSLGARVFSDVVPDALARAGLKRVVQQCRASDIERVRAAYAEAGIEATLATFFPDVAERLAAAGLVIARAGASTVAELAVAGRPSILVPLPGAIDDHQTANGRALAEAGGAWLIPQSEFTAERLAAKLRELFADPAMLRAAAARALALARPDAAARLADFVEARA